MGADIANRGRTLVCSWHGSGAEQPLAKRAVPAPESYRQNMQDDNRRQVLQLVYDIVDDRGLLERQFVMVEPTNLPSYFWVTCASSRCWAAVLGSAAPVRSRRSATRSNHPACGKRQTRYSLSNSGIHGFDY
jgi:hypothetical protein